MPAGRWFPLGVIAAAFSSAMALAQQPNRSFAPMPNTGVGGYSSNMGGGFQNSQGFRRAPPVAARLRPAPVIEQRPPPPRGGLAWRHGFWAFRYPQWFWVPGVYLEGYDIPPMPADLIEDVPPPPPEGGYWVNGHWEWGDGQGWVWIPGAWYTS